MDGKQNILFVGRFEQRKGAKYLLQAIPAIRESHPNTRFLLVGDGHLKHNLQEFVERQRWHDVIFTGYIGTEDLPHYFASAHIFCAPATGGESMGIVLLEAMASGTPIVATTIDGYTTVVTSGVDGLLTKPRQSQELAYAVGQLLDNEPLRQHFIQKGLQTVREYDWPQVARRILDYYAQLFDLYNITILSPATGK
jgi:phosphatidyl-myo-inositol alpha-mannosyltransferase